MESTLLKDLIRNVVICMATASILVACGGDSPSSSQAQLLVSSSSVKISIPAANVTASSTDTTNVPANTIDNNLGTHWTGGAASGTQWIQFKLPSCYGTDFAKISWYNGDQRQYDFTIEASANGGATWTTVKTMTSTGTSAGLVQIDFPNTTANLMRVTSTGSDVSTKVSINEVEFWGSAGGTCTSATTTTTKATTTTTKATTTTTVATTTTTTKATTTTTAATTSTTAATTTTTKTTTTTTGLNTNLPPGGNFNLGIWQLQLPTPNSTLSSNETISGTSMENGATKYPYFYTDTSDGSMVMMDPIIGFGTGNTLHARTELRENGDWPTSGTNQLDATLKVTKVPSSATTIAQIFQGAGAPLSKPLCELQYGSNGAIKLMIEPTSVGTTTGKSLIWITDFPTVALGAQITYRIKVTGSTVTVTVNGIVRSFTMDSSFNGENFYFKAGNYWQGATISNTTVGTAEGSVVKFYALKITH